MLQHLAPFIQAETIKKLTEEPNPKRHKKGVPEVIVSGGPLVTDRVQALTTVFVKEGYDSVTATQQAYAQIKNVVRENAYIMAFNDAFLVVAGSLLAGAVLVWLCHQAKAVPGAVAH